MEQIESADHIETKRTLVSIHFGFTGKQEATLAFLLSVINCSKPQTLLLFSDESFDWLGQNPEFAGTQSEIQRFMKIFKDKQSVLREDSPRES